MLCTIILFKTSKRSSQNANGYTPIQTKRIRITLPHISITIQDTTLVFLQHTWHIPRQQHLGVCLKIRNAL